MDEKVAKMFELREQLKHKKILLRSIEMELITELAPEHPEAFRINYARLEALHFRGDL
jgi:hypothetical protein